MSQRATEGKGPIRSYVDLHVRGHFEAIHQTQEQLGDGLYLAPDPIQSVHYSGKPGLLLRVRVPAGMRYVDMRANHKSWPVTRDESFKVHCELYRECHRDSPTDASCSGMTGIFSRFCFSAQEKDYYVSPRYDDTKRLGPVIKRVYVKNKIDALAAVWGSDVYPECGDVKKAAKSERAVLNFSFMTPHSLEKVEYDLLVPNLEKNPTPEKKKIYQEVMTYFDMLDVQEVFKDAATNAEVKQGLDKFWEYYRGWATSLYNLPSDANIVAFQHERYLKTQKDRSKFISNMYGCSGEKTFQYEVASPGEKKAH